MLTSHSRNNVKLASQQTLELDTPLKTKNRYSLQVHVLRHILSNLIKFIMSSDKRVYVDFVLRPFISVLQSLILDFLLFTFQKNYSKPACIFLPFTPTWTKCSVHYNLLHSAITGTKEKYIKYTKYPLPRLTAISYVLPFRVSLLVAICKNEGWRTLISCIRKAKDATSEIPRH